MPFILFFFFFNDTATTEIYTLSLHDALPISLVRTIAATIRYRYDDRSDFFNGPPRGPALYCFWHNRLALCTALYVRYVQERNPTAGMAAMISASRDGAFLSSIFEGFNVEPVRGSSS